MVNGISGSTGILNSGITIQAGSTVVIIGTSLIDGGWRDYEESVHRGYSDKGVSSWLRTMKNQQFDLINVGIGGNTTNDMLNRFGSDVVTKNPDVVIVASGTNDHADDEATIKSELAELYALVESNGYQLIIETIPMRGATNWDATKQAKMISVNDWIMETYPNKYINSNKYFAPESNGNRPLPNYTVDAVHYQSIGAYAVAKAYDDAITVLGSRDIVGTSLTSNPTGTGSSSITQGTIPTGWSIVDDSEIGTPTIATVANDPSLTVTVTPDGTAGQQGIRIALPELSSLDATKLYEFIAKIKASDWDGWREISLRFRRDGTSDINSYDMWDDYKDEFFPNDGFLNERLLRTHHIPTYDGDTTRFVPYIYVYFNGDASGSGTIDVSLGQVQTYTRPSGQDLAAHFPDIEVGFRANTSKKVYSSGNIVEQVYGHDGVPFRDYNSDGNFQPIYDATLFGGRGGLDFSESTNQRLIANANIPANCIVYGVFETDPSTASNNGNRDILYLSTSEAVQSNKRLVILGSSGSLRWYAGGVASSEIIGNSTRDWRGQRVAYILEFKNGVLDGRFESSTLQESEFNMDIDDAYIDCTRFITSGRNMYHAEQWLSHATFDSIDITPTQLMTDLKTRWGI